MSKTIWFASDHHLGHANIIKFCNRPFATTDEMDECLIKNHNELVHPDDDVYFNGDFAFPSYSGEKLLKTINRFHGNKHLILGNHDHPTDWHWRGFKWIKDYYELKIDKRRAIVLFHYAMRVWNKSHHGSIHLYGHSHGTLPDDATVRSFDVGVDCWDYKPLSLKQVEKVIAKKQWKPVDHHGAPEQVKMENTIPIFTNLPQGF
jgi:calcineurin-like phosphoesterase family protein